MRLGAARSNVEGDPYDPEVELSSQGKERLSLIGHHAKLNTELALHGRSVAPDPDDKLSVREQLGYLAERGRARRGRVVRGEA